MAGQYLNVGCERASSEIGDHGIRRDFTRPVAALKGSTVYTVDTDHLGTPRIISEGYSGIVWTWISTDTDKVQRVTEALSELIASLKQ